MARNHFLRAVSLGLIIGGALILASCPSPLLTNIEETVELAVKPPEIKSQYPVVNATDIPTNLDAISITFTKEILGSSVTSGTFKVTGPDGTAVSGSFDISNDTVTFEPSGTLSYNTEYTVTVTSDLRDSDGNGFPAEFSFTFTTGLAPDTVKPTGDYVIINGGAPWTTSQSVTLEIKGLDNYGVAQLNISNTDTFGESGWLTYEPGPGVDYFSTSWDLSAGDGSKIVYVKFKDGAGNTSDTPEQNSIILDTTPANVDSLAINGRSVALNGDPDGGKVSTNLNTVSIILQASDGTGSGAFEFFYQLKDDTGTWQPFEPGVSIDQETGLAVINPVTLLMGAGNAQEFQGQLTDVAGNTSSLFTFEVTYEVDPPFVIESDPADGSSTWYSNADRIHVNFNEGVQAISPENFYLLDGSTVVKGTEVTLASVADTEYENAEKATLSGISVNKYTTYTVVLTSDITDLAGNPLTTNTANDTYEYSFSTGDANDLEPPYVGTLALDFSNPPGSGHYTETATRQATLALDVFSDDLHNTLYGMKLWGDNDIAQVDPDTTLPYPAFEQNANWQTYKTTKTWHIPTGSDGSYYLYVRFMDSASNETDPPYRLKVNYDNTAPVLSNVTIDGGATHTNDSSGNISLVIDASDATSGLSNMRYSFDGVFDSSASYEDWFTWNPIQSITLVDPAVEELKTISVEVQDMVELTSTTEIASITLDLTDPTIEFLEAQQRITNSAVALDGNFGDNFPSNIASYLWETIDGPATGVLTLDDNSLEFPVASADVEGKYTLQVTVTDNASNYSLATVPFMWDVTAPPDIQNIALRDQEGNLVVGIYTNSPQPYVEWDPVLDVLNDPNGIYGIFYRVGFETPDWDNPAWLNYEQMEQPVISAPAPAVPGDNDGPTTLYITAWDLAYNRSNTTVDATIDLFIDTIDPYIGINNQYFLANLDRVIHYDDDSDGIVYDINGPGHIGAPEPGRGSGISTVLWEETSATGNVTILNETTLAPTLTGTVDGQYEITLTVTDMATNVTSAVFTFDWDTTPPAMPTVNSIGHTPNATPTWTWYSNGGGNGEFRYRLDRIQVDNVDASPTHGDEIGTVEQVFDWIPTPTTNTSYKPSGTSIPTSPTVLDDGYKYTLYVQERDAAGNWSTTGDFAIWRENDFISEPSLVLAGNYLKNATETLVRWDWESGAGIDTASDYYRIQLDGGGWNDTTDSFYEVTLGHGVHTLQVEERNTDLSWFAKIASSSVEVDTIVPGTPTVSASTPTPNTFPTWSWTAGTGDGIGEFQYQFESETVVDTIATNYTRPTSLADGSYTLQVWERDEAGNWSAPGSKTVTVDTIAPTGTVSIDSGQTYTNTLNVTLAITGAGSPSQMRFLNSGYSWSTWEPYGTTKSWTLPNTSDGNKTVYVQFQDAAGNYSNTYSDYIFLDRTAPTLSTFNINSNAISTSGTYVTLYSTYGGASTMYVRNGAGGWSSYSASSARNWYLSGGYGVKKVEVYFEDPAGNTSPTLTDYIHYGQTSLLNTTKGSTTDGDITLNFNGYGSEVGTNYYRVYYSSSPTGTKYYISETTNSSSINLTGLTKGYLYYFHIRMRNSSAGYSDRYSNYMIGFSSNVTIIYDDDEPADYTKANAIKSLLTWTTFPDSYSSITGTMPTWTATLVPEDEVVNSWTTTDDRYIIYGDPIIVTPGTYLSSYPNKVRNIVHKSIRVNNALPATDTESYTVYFPGIGFLTFFEYFTGVVAMGYGGAYFLDTVESYWSSWGYPTGSLADANQYPTDIGIGGGEAYLNSAPDVFAYQWTYNGSTVWNTPLTSTSFVDTFPIDGYPDHNTLTQLSYAPLGGSATTSDYRVMNYRPNFAIPVNGELIVHDYYGGNATTYYFPVVRQGRFLQYGFPTLIDRPFTGKALFVNLIAKMDNY